MTNKLLFKFHIFHATMEDLRPANMKFMKFEQTKQYLSSLCVTSVLIAKSSTYEGV